MLTQIDRSEQIIIATKEFSNSSCHVNLYTNRNLKLTAKQFFLKITNIYRLIGTQDSHFEVLWGPQVGQGFLYSESGQPSCSVVVPALFHHFEHHNQCLSTEHWNISHTHRYEHFNILKHVSLYATACQQQYSESSL